MPITETNVIGDVEVLPDGRRRGTLEFVFDDAEVITRVITATDATKWAEFLVDYPAIIEQERRERDAQDGVSPDAEVIAKGEASIEDRAVAYLREAYNQQNAWDAFLLFDKFNDFRLARGWNLNQVQAGLMSAGLTEDEWANMRSVYQYLAGAGRPAVMDTARTIQATWEDRER